MNQCIGHFPPCDIIQYLVTSHVITLYSIGFVLGVVLSYMLFSIITSSVHAVICCFAGHPIALLTNHPMCSHVMREAWRESWPGYVDLVVVDDEGDDGRNNRDRRNVSIGAGLSSSSSPFLLERNDRESLFV